MMLPVMLLLSGWDLGRGGTVFVSGLALVGTTFLLFLVLSETGQERCKFGDLTWVEEDDFDEVCVGVRKVEELHQAGEKEG